MVADRLELVPQGVFLSVLEQYSQHFQYSIGAEPREVRSAEDFLIPSAESLIRYLPLKSSWFLEEIVGFEGAEFAFAATRAMQQRAPTAAETHRFATTYKPSAKLEFLLQLDHANRRAKSGARLHDIGLSRTLWHVHRRLEKWKLRPLARVAHGLFRARARRELHCAMKPALVRQLCYTCMDRIERTVRQ